MSLSPPDKPSLAHLFLAGRHADVLNQALLDDDAHFDPTETPAVVASLATLGQPGDAEALLSHQRDLLTPADQAFALYHLATAGVAGGRYDEARRYLGRLFSLRNLTNVPSALFFVYQGVAYYRFATGRLLGARRVLHRAGGFARRAAPAGARTGTYVTLLWHELLGHLQAMTGDLAEGLASLAVAKNAATELGRADAAHALGVATALYTARYRQRPDDAAAALLRLSLALPLADRFGRASVLLELVRQQALSGRTANARETLNSVTTLVLGLGSRRYETVLSLRLADVLASEGNLAAGLVVVTSALRPLSGEADALLELELQARRRGLLAGLGLETQHEAAERLAVLERSTGFVRPLDPPVHAPPVHHAEVAADGLNHRQLSFLRELTREELVDVHAYRKRYSVSEITACRDLAGLARRQYLKRIGKARATRYALGDKPAPL